MKALVNLILEHGHRAYGQEGDDIIYVASQCSTGQWHHETIKADAWAVFNWLGY